MDINDIKRRIYLMRNGIVADALRKGGSPFRMIFGVNLPQLAEIAADTPKDPQLARALWADINNRESMLIATMLMPADAIDIEEAIAWTDAIPATEVADVLCLKLLRNLPYASELADNLAQSTSDMQRYTALRLMINIYTQFPDQARRIASDELAHKCPLTERIASRLLTELDYL